MLTGTLRNAQGGVAAEMRLAARLTFGSRRDALYLATDADGRFSITVRGALPADAAPGQLLLEPGEPSRGISIYVPPAHRALVSLPDPLPATTVDLGIITLAPRPLAVRGAVLDADAQPVSGASVELTLDDGDDHPTAYSVRSNADGSFELHVDHPVLAGTVAAGARGYVASQPRPFAPGATDVVIRLPRAGHAVGAVTCADPLAPRAAAAEGFAERR